MTTARVALPHPIDATDLARANFYALLARLFATAPDAGLLRALAAEPRLPEIGDGGLPRAFNRLAEASSVMDPGAATQEYTDLFIGVGKSEVNLHASHWLAGAMMERPLVKLRSELAALGIARREDASMVEDHLAALCETMRFLIAGTEGRPPAPITDQRRFFEAYITSWAFLCCNAIRHSDIANYYRQVAELCDCFMALERDALAMD